MSSIVLAFAQTSEGNEMLPKSEGNIGPLVSIRCPINVADGLSLKKVDESAKDDFFRTFVSSTQNPLVPISAKFVPTPSRHGQRNDICAITW